MRYIHFCRSSMMLEILLCLNISPKHLVKYKYKYRVISPRYSAEWTLWMPVSVQWLLIQRRSDGQPGFKVRMRTSKRVQFEKALALIPSHPVKRPFPLPLASDVATDASTDGVSAYATRYYAIGLPHVQAWLSFYTIL